MGEPWGSSRAEQGVFTHFEHITLVSVKSSTTDLPRSMFQKQPWNCQRALRNYRSRRARSFPTTQLSVSLFSTLLFPRKYVPEYMYIFRGGMHIKKDSTVFRYILAVTKYLHIHCFEKQLHLDSDVAVLDRPFQSKHGAASRQEFQTHLKTCVAKSRAFFLSPAALPAGPPR